jgi:hypothetical protein
MDEKYIFYRRNAYDHDDTPPTICDEGRVRSLLASTFKDVEKKVARLKAGATVHNTYATYWARTERQALREAALML